MTPPVMTVPAQGRTSKSELAYTYLRDRITRRVLGPGYRLVLQTIADELGVSVVPVREAVRRLEAEGLITTERNVGARVAMLDTNGFLATIEALGVVESAAIALSVPHLGRAELDEAYAVNERMRHLLSDFSPRTFTALNRQFHTILSSRCPNGVLLDLVGKCWTQLELLRDSTFAFIPDRALGSVQEHSRLLELIEAGATDVELAARSHLQGTMRALKDLRDREGAQLNALQL